MVVNSEQFRANALADQTNDVGMCLQQVRMWAGIPSKFGDATEAWHHTDHRITGDLPPNCVVWWTGGSGGHGHVAAYLGDGMIRSTDAPSRGRVGTVPLDWVRQNWGLPYAGASWDINDVVIPHPAQPGPTPPPTPSGGVIPMTDITIYRRHDDIALPNDWYTIPITDPDEDGVRTTIAAGPGEYFATINIKPNSGVWARCLYVDDTGSGTPAVVNHEPPVWIEAGGGQVVSYGNIPEIKKGKRKLRVEVKPAAPNTKITEVEVRVGR